MLVGGRVAARLQSCSALGGTGRTNGGRRDATMVPRPGGWWPISDTRLVRRWPALPNGWAMDAMHK